MIIWKSDPSVKIKREFFQPVAMLVLLYVCTTWMKHLEKKLDRNYISMLYSVLNTSSRQHPIKQQRYGHLPSVLQTMSERQTRHTGYCLLEQQGASGGVMVSKLD